MRWWPVFLPPRGELTQRRCAARGGRIPRRWGPPRGRAEGHDEPLWIPSASTAAALDATVREGPRPAARVGATTSRCALAGDRGDLVARDVAPEGRRRRGVRLRQEHALVRGACGTRDQRRTRSRLVCPRERTARDCPGSQRRLSPRRHLGGRGGRPGGGLSPAREGGARGAG